mmetsp:Transcript_30023/g.35396  ORF Transcript_30023/g.35396 Transcript_30023/m.35396 type:complete len:231 (+) Transcript_30023:96-788(+)|eukprot:CAMPEP_0114358104 /NCGR_PEP_ID=MMETSP0101-20121206/22085_1 /TAXON_ID=38822 ORGANISM="Pteridomonas danica, Strain PT" /NCGR_SAMPLE_ID=MMETSP0101 /ASSEMBLY_ACC=CAM_ASM_000211 /LENGTH=230 /DNA_ID=CAMNT_0001501117 /DNA_START=51 /DNA_END=743 /DNA_ORIENTATION=+
MDGAFRDYDKLAFEKHQAILERRAVLDPPPPGPTSKMLYGNVIVHKSSHRKKYEHLKLIEDKKEALRKHVAKTRRSRTKSKDGEGGGGGSQAGIDGGDNGSVYSSIDDQDNQSLTSFVSSSQSLLNANRSKVTIEDLNQWLLKNGFDPDYITKPKPFGWSPMHQCAEEGNLQIMMYLYDNCYHKNVECLKKKDDGGISPLQLASMRTDLSMCRWLHTNGAADVYKYDPFM